MTYDTFGEVTLEAHESIGPEASDELANRKIMILRDKAKCLQLVERSSDNPDILIRTAKELAYIDDLVGIEDSNRKDAEIGDREMQAMANVREALAELYSCTTDQITKIRAKDMIHEFERIVGIN